MKLAYCFSFSTMQELARYTCLSAMSFVLCTRKVPDKATHPHAMPEAQAHTYIQVFAVYCSLV